MKKISTVEVTPGCITCGTCEFIAPEVFEITDFARVLPCVRYQDFAQKIKLAQEACPVKVIHVEEVE